MNNFKRMYIYKETHLPKEGWLQGCFLCHIITGNCEIFSRYYNYENKKLIEFVVYLCHRCKNLILKDKEIKKEYDTYVHKYIKNTGIISLTTRKPLPSFCSSSSSSSSSSYPSSSSLPSYPPPLLLPPPLPPPPPPPQFPPPPPPNTPADTPPSTPPSTPPPSTPSPTISPI